jgi:hypothetical protein
MPLPDRAVLKDYLRIETEAEDTPLSEMLDRAEAFVRHLVDRPIEDEERSYRIEGDTTRSRSLDRLLFPQPPLDTASLEITDGEGATVDDADYHVDGGTGVIRGLDGFRFGTFPYTLTADNGLEQRAQYEVIEEPMLSEAILAYAAMLYHQRNPNAGTESIIGASVTYQGMAMPLRTKEVVLALRKAL